MPKWTVGDIPDQRGRVALVTGASNGIGFATALELARRGAHVIVGARDKGRGEAAMARIGEDVAGASLELGLADLGDLDQVKALAARVRADHPSLDLLINNAGTMMAEKSPTAQGHEQHFGINYLGHFALTLALLPAMSAGNARVVGVSSLAHRHWRLNPDDLQARGLLLPYLHYARSKLALALFGIELDRRLRAAGSPIVSVIAHPGFAGTNLAAGMARGPTRLWLAYVFPRFGQSLVAGAGPTLYAATMPGVTGGEFYGPDGLFELKGAPRRVKLSWRARDPETARRLWDRSEELTEMKLLLK
jgi:NAD(P)-dependent dehydrogenase (short-subunit alcohol dehydrogenase family)